MPSWSRLLPPLIALVIGAVLSWWLVQRPSELQTSMVAPSRVVLFAPNLTETAWALGHGDKVVGVTDYCVWPPELLARPRVGGMIDPNFERLVALEPDLVVLQGENPSLRTFAREQGLEVFDLKMDDEIDSILGGIVRLDSLLTGGNDASGRALVATMRAQLDSLESLDGKAPRTLLVLGREPDSLQGLFTAGPGTFLDQLLRIAGAEPWIAGGRPGYRMVALEALVADPPEVAIEVGAGVPGDGAEKIWRDLGLSDVRVERLDFDGAMIPGPRLVETARRLRQRVHPEPPRGDS